MKFYLKQMEELGIPVEIAGETIISNQIVLKGFVKLYCYLSSPYDLRVKKGAGHIIARGDVLEAQDDEKTRLEELGENTKGMNAYAIAQYLLNHIEYVLPWGVELTKTYKIFNTYKTLKIFYMY